MANRNFNGVQINSSVTIVEKAKSDIADVRNRIMKYDEEGSIVLAESGGDVPIGIAIIEAGINDISGVESGKVCAGDDVDIQIKDIGYIIAGEYIEKGNYVAAGPEGKAVKAKDGDFALGIAIGEAAEGEFCRVLISRTVCTKATPENGADHITFNLSDETGYGTKKVSDIVGSDVKIDWNGTKGKVTGTFPKVEDWKELPKEPKSGHFFAVKINEKYKGKKFTFYEDGVEKSSTDSATEDEMFWVLRIDTTKNFKFVSGDSEVIAELDFTDAKLK